MNAFERASQKAGIDHARWSTRERQRLAQDSKAIAAAITSGAIFSLTKADRDALVAAYGGPTIAPAKLPPLPRKTRKPQAIAAATTRASARQSWTKGEFAHACKTAALRSSVTLCLGVLALSILWWIQHS